MDPSVSVGIITYNSSNDIAQCIESISESADEIIVIDNGSTDDTCEKALSAQSFVKVQVIELKKNMGFGHACNVALDNARNNLVLILNPDTRLFANTIDFLAESINDDVVVSVPQIEKNDQIQYSIRRFPTHKRTAMEAILPGKFMRYLSSSEIISNYDAYSYDHYVDWATGACWLMDKSFIQSIGGYSNDWFLYSEEVDLAWRIAFSKKKILYTHKAHIYHRAGEQHSNPILYTLGQVNKLIFLHKVKGRKPFFVWLSFVLGSAMRSNNEESRYCLRKLLQYQLSLYKLRKYLIAELGGTVE